MNNLYFIEGYDKLGLDEEVKKIISKTKFDGNDINYYDIDEVPLSLALEDIDTYSFLTPKKVVVIKNINDTEEESVKHFYKYLDNSSEDVLLIITTTKKLDERKKLTKTLKTKLNYIKVELDEVKFIKSRLEDYKIDNNAIKLLQEYCQGDLLKIDNECEKLKLYKDEEKEVNETDIKDIVIKKLGNKDDLVFSLSRHIATKDKKNALLTYKELIKHGVESFEIIGLIASQFRLLLQIKLLESYHMNDFDMGKKLEENPYRIKKSKELLYLYTKEDLMSFIKVLADIDYKTKVGKLEPTIVIEMLIINI